MNLKVAVIIDTWFPFVGGGQINAYEISKLLAKKGVKIDIITRNCGEDKLDIPKNLRIIKLGKKSKPADIFSKLTFIYRSFAFIVKNKYDLVHAHAFLPGLTAMFTSALCRIPSIITVHGTSIGTDLNNILWRFTEKIILTKIKYAAQITVSRDFIKLKNVNKNISYIPNAVDINLFEKVSPTKPARLQIIFVGRLHLQKNIQTLLKSMSSLTRNFPSLQLIIIGNGSQKQAIQEEIHKNQLSKNIKLLGEVRGEALIRLYKSSNLLVLPSIYEGQPLVLLEAWAAKIPVVTTKTGDSQYLVKDGINGYLLDNPEDFRKLAKIIKIALLNKKLHELGLNGFDFIKSNYSWEKSADLTLSVYKKYSKLRNV